MILKHLKFVMSLLLVVLMFIPASVLVWMLKEEALFKNMDDVKECYDMIKFSVYELDN